MSNAMLPYFRPEAKEVGIDGSSNRRVERSPTGIRRPIEYDRLIVFKVQPRGVIGFALIGRKALPKKCLLRQRRFGQWNRMNM